MLEQAGIPVENTQNPQVEQPPMPGQEQMGGGGGMPATGMESITAMQGPPMAKMGMKVGPGSTTAKKKY